MQVGPLVFDAILVLDGKKINDLDAFERAMNERQAFYGKFGVGDYVHVYILDTDQPISLKTYPHRLYFK